MTRRGRRALRGLRKNAFIGRDVVPLDRDERLKRRLVTLTVAADGADVSGDEAFWHDGDVVGWVTSDGYVHFVDRSVALAYVPNELATENGGFEVEIICDRRAADCSRSRSSTRSGHACWGEVRAAQLSYAVAPAAQTTSL